MTMCAIIRLSVLSVYGYMDLGSSRVVKNDAITDQAGTLVPDLLLVLGLEAEFPEVRVGDRPSQLVVTLPAV